MTCGADHCPADTVYSASELDTIRHKVIDAIARAAALRRNGRDAVAHQVAYIVGDFVWLHRPVRRKGLSPKLQRPWSGPYEVVEVLSPQTYRIRLAGKGKRTTMVVHHDRIKPCIVREDESYSEPPSGSNCRPTAVPPTLEGSGEEATDDDDGEGDCLLLQYRGNPEREEARELGSPVGRGPLVPRELVNELNEDGEVDDVFVEAEEVLDADLAIPEDDVFVGAGAEPALDPEPAIAAGPRRSTRNRNVPDRLGEWEY